MRSRSFLFRLGFAVLGVLSMCVFGYLALGWAVRAPELWLEPTRKDARSSVATFSTVISLHTERIRLQASLPLSFSQASLKVSDSRCFGATALCFVALRSSNTSSFQKGEIV